MSPGNGGTPAGAAHAHRQAQDVGRVGAAIDEVAAEPDPVLLAEATAFEQALERDVAALDVADRINAHLAGQFRMPGTDSLNSGIGVLKSTPSAPSLPMFWLVFSM